MTHWLVTLLCALAILVWLLWRVAAKARLNDFDSESWRPVELRQARLAYAEHEFYIESPERLVARVDRVYETNGRYFLTELKHRDRAVVFQTDQIELSAQAAALEGFDRKPVSPVAFVVTESSTGIREALPVQLLPREEVWRLARRFRSLLDGTIRPHKVNKASVCRDCEFLKECKPDIAKTE